MTRFTGTPSDDLDAVLAVGRTDVSSIFVSLSARDPDGRDAEYVEWHTLDHRPEQHRLAELRGSFRLVSTPECRAARAASDDRLDAVDHVMAYLFSAEEAPRSFFELGRALHEGGRMPHRLPSVDAGSYSLAETAAAPRVVAGADVVPWRPNLGAYVLVETGDSDLTELCEVDGVAGVWWATRLTDGATEQVSFCFVDDDPVAVAGRLQPVLERRWSEHPVHPMLAAPFHTVVPFEWDRHLP